jgi:hypothetical protein
MRSVVDIPFFHISKSKRSTNAVQTAQLLGGQVRANTDDKLPTT